MTLRILIAPSGFKESLEVNVVTDCIETGILRVLPNAHIYKMPLVDGGEGFAKAMVATTDGTLHNVMVTGPVGQLVQAHYGFLGGADSKTAVLEMATAAGLRLVPPEMRDPLITTTYGVGELIKAALDSGAKRLLIGCGDSGTVDGGAGMAQALGLRFLDNRGNELGWGGGELARLEHIDTTNRDPRLGEVQVDVACNLHSLLCGPNGTARTYGPQKGASPETTEQLAAALEHYATVIRGDIGIDVSRVQGSGSAGGLGTGLHVFLGAVLHSYSDITMKHVDFDSLLRQVDLVITGEGCIDARTPRGKIPIRVAERAKRINLPVIAIVGMFGQNAHLNLEHGIDGFFNILEAPCTLSDAIEDASKLLTDAAERVMRLILVGQKLDQSRNPKLSAGMVGQDQFQESY